MIPISLQYVITAIGHNQWRLLSMNKEGTIEVIEGDHTLIMDWLDENLSFLGIIPQ